MSTHNTTKSTTLYCFTPLVTLVTFVIEIALALITLFKYHKTPFGRLSALFFTLLAIFQFSEYMLCAHNGTQFWTQLGWIAISFLPPIGVHLSTMMGKKSHWMPIGYAIATIFAVLFATSAAAPQARCIGTAVDFFGTSSTFSSLYSLFYFWFIAVALWILTNIWRSKNTMSMVAGWFMVGYAAFIIPTFAVYVVSPVSRESFPSIFCGFAIFLALIGIGKVLPLYHKHLK
jgi:hypothetical protein